MKEKTLIDGMYLAEHDNGMFDRYKIIVKVTECEKSYRMELIGYKSRCSPVHIDALFEKSKTVVISKKSVKHVIRLWSNESFTLYPFKSGIPFSFRLMEENTAIKRANGKKIAKKKTQKNVFYVTGRWMNFMLNEYGNLRALSAKMFWMIMSANART